VVRYRPRDLCARIDLSYDNCVVLILSQTIPGCKNLGREETRYRRGKAKWRVLGKELAAWLRKP
jgi:hypothetical protein